MQRRTSQIVYRWVAGLLALAVVIAADLTLGSLGAPPQQQRFRRSDPVYHHGFFARVDAPARWGPLRYRMATNSLGMRDTAPRDVPLRGERRRLLLIGDSFTEGVGLNFEETFAGLLARELAPDIEVLNAAAVSYSPKLYHLRVRQLIEDAGLEFDELMVFIDVSDIQDEIHYRSFEPRPARDSESLGARVSQRIRAFFDNHSLVVRTARKLSSPENEVDNSFAADEWAEGDVWFEDLDAFREAFAKTNDPQAAQRDAQKDRWTWTFRKDVFEEWGREGLQLAATHMQKLSELCRRHEIPLTIVVYPAAQQIFVSDLKSIQARYWGDFAKKHELGFVNLFPSFIDKRFESPRAIYRAFFIENDSHWNAAGHRLVADRIRDHLAQVPRSRS